MNNEVTRRGKRKEAPFFRFCMEVDLDKWEFGVGHSWLSLSNFFSANAARKTIKDSQHSFLEVSLCGVNCYTQWPVTPSNVTVNFSDTSLIPQHFTKMLISNHNFCVHYNSNKCSNDSFLRYRTNFT